MRHGRKKNFQPKKRGLQIENDNVDLNNVGVVENFSGENPLLVDDQ